MRLAQACYGRPGPDRRLGRFHVLSVHFDRDAAPDQFESQNDAPIILLANQNALHPFHRPGPDADPLSFNEVGMGLEGFEFHSMA